MRLFTRSELISLPYECKCLVVLNALFQGGRLFIGAICVLYFLSFGLEMADYAWIKGAQVIIFIGLDIPLGFFLNRIGEYKSLIASICFGILGVIGYLTFTSFLGFLISEMFLALSISSWMVSLSAYSMKILEKYQIKGLTEKFFHISDAFSNLFIVICGTIGGIFYVFNKYIPYGCFLIFYLIAFSFILLYLKNLDIVRTEKRVNIDFNISSIRKMKPVLSFVSILFFSQFLFQPLLHYWQPLFKMKFELSSKDMSLIFITYSLAMSIISWSYSRLTHFSNLRSNLIIIISSFIGIVSYNLFSIYNIFIYSLLLFAISFGLFNFIQVAIGISIQKKLEHKNRIIITKYVSFLSRTGMIFSLIFLHFLFANEWEITEIYSLYGILAALIFCLYAGIIFFQKIRREKYATDL